MWWTHQSQAAARIASTRKITKAITPKMIPVIAPADRDVLSEREREREREREGEEREREKREREERERERCNLLFGGVSDSPLSSSTISKNPVDLSPSCSNPLTKTTPAT